MKIESHWKPKIEIEHFGFQKSRGSPRFPFIPKGIQAEKQRISLASRNFRGFGDLSGVWWRCSNRLASRALRARHFLKISAPARGFGPFGRRLMAPAKWPSPAGPFGPGNFNESRAPTRGFGKFGQRLMALAKFASPGPSAKGTRGQGKRGPPSAPQSTRKPAKEPLNQKTKALPQYSDLNYDHFLK